MHRNRKIWGIVLAVLYVALLFAITLAERNAPGSAIRSVWDALWLSMVTITTVGYGDLAPVTPAGRILCLVFLLLSAGFLAFLVSLAARWLSGRLLPALRIRLDRSPRWYLFSEWNAESAALAKNLMADRPDSLALFCGAERLPPEAEDRCLAVPEEAETLLSRKEAARHDVTLFLWGKEEENLSAALRLAGRVRIVCRGQQEAMMLLPKEVLFFDPEDSAARTYWRDYPLRASENRILLVGSGSLARALLHRSLLTNVLLPFRQTEIHVFGDWSDYRRRHYRLEDTVSLNETKPGQDALFFHEGPWNGDPELLARADRIILCMDQPAENLALAGRLLSWYTPTGTVDARLDESLPGIRSFGGPERLLTGDNVLRERLNALARSLHAHYRQEQGEAAVPAWEELDRAAHESNAAAADHLTVKARLLTGLEEEPPGLALFRQARDRYAALDEAAREVCRRNEHERWCRFYRLRNWTPGPVRDPLRRTHPCLVPFDALSPEDQAKDDYAWKQLETVAEMEEIRK